MLNQVRKTIFCHTLIEPGDRVLVALSGGADSVCLLDCLMSLQDELGISVAAAHLNHCLRGDESDGDEAFVRQLCEERQLPLFVCRKDIRVIAKETGTGLEAAGRNARYAFFHDLQKKEGFHKIATAHHAGDNIETVLMRLVRGTGPSGLGGIPYKNGTVIRPLLDVTRQDIEAYTKEHALSFRTDSTNSEKIYTRNRVRHSLVPLIEQEYNPNFQKNFQEQIKLYSACSDYLKNEVQKLCIKLTLPFSGGYAFDCSRLLQEPAFLISMLLHTLLQELADGQILACHVEAAKSLVAEGKGAVSMPGGVIAEVCHKRLYLRRNIPVKTFFYDLPHEGELFIPETNGYIICQIVTEIPEHRKADSVYLDIQKLSGKKLSVRSRQAGDYFYPKGLCGRKKLQDYFVDNKIPHFMRDTIPVITAGEDIVWLAGLRADERFVKTKGKGPVFCIRYIKEDAT